MSHRWEHLLDQKPIPLIDHLVGEAAKLIAAEYVKWPLELEAEPDPAAVFAPDAPRPAPAAYRIAVQLAKWDVGHELDAYDDYMRNRRYLAEGLPERDRGVLLALSRWLVEQMLALGEHTQGRVNRRRKVDCLDGLLRETERLLPG